MSSLKNDISLWLDAYKNGTATINDVIHHLPFVFENHGYMSKSEIDKKIQETSRVVAMRCGAIYSESHHKAEGYEIDSIREEVESVRYSDAYEIDS